MRHRQSNSNVLHLLIRAFHWLWVNVLGTISLLVAQATGSHGTLTLERGTRVRYKLQPVAEGGYSYIYKATEVRTGELCALKRISTQNSEQRDLAAAELRSHREFHHPNLMPVLDWATYMGHTGQDFAYFLFPWMDGGTLRDWIDLRVLGGGGGGARPSDAEILSLFEGVCRGVRELHCHEPPFAHRDLKPDNVMLVHRDGPPVLTDLGSAAPAKVVVRNRTEALAVQDDAAQFCTMPYRAPELFDVASDAVIDAKIDVWSLGCLLFAMCFGYSPFECEFGADGKPRVVECSFLRVIGTVTFPAHCACSASLRQLILWMLEQDPGGRPTIDAVLERVAAIRTVENGSSQIAIDVR